MGVKSPSQHIHQTSKAVLCEVRRFWPSCHRLSGLFGVQVGAFLDDGTASLCPRVLFLPPWHRAAPLAWLARVLDLGLVCSSHVT